jgi:hypothetical protein
MTYRMIENELFDQNWRTRSKGDQVRYVVLKWAFCFAIGILTGIVGFVINLAVENVAGFKHQAVSALMDSTRCVRVQLQHCLALLSPLSFSYQKKAKSGSIRRQQMVLEFVSIYFVRRPF